MEGLNKHVLKSKPVRADQGTLRGKEDEWK
jgi:hypothetical protein